MRVINSSKEIALTISEAWEALDALEHRVEDLKDLKAYVSEEEQRDIQEVSDDYLKVAVILRGLLEGGEL